MLPGVLLALATSVCWALGNVFIQKSGRAVGAPRAMLWALLAGCALAGAASLALDRPAAPATAATAGWVALAGVAGLVAYAGLFHAFARAPLSVAVPIVSAWALVAGALALTVLGERVGATKLAGAVAVVAGVVCASAAPRRAAGGEAGGDAGGRDPRALWAAAASALGFGVMLPALTRASPALGEFGAASLVYLAVAALGAPVALARGVPVAPPPAAVWGLVLATGLFETAGFVALAFARRYAPVAVVGPVASLASVFTVLYAWAFLGERPGPVVAVGALVAGAGVVVMAA